LDRSPVRSPQRRPDGCGAGRFSGRRGQAGEHDASKKRLADAEKRLRRFQDAIAAGIEPSGLVDAINQAQAQRVAAQAELEGVPAPGTVTDAEVYAMVDSLRDVGAALKEAILRASSACTRRFGWRSDTNHTSEP
jgi:hypothetical protein